MIFAGNTRFIPHFFAAVVFLSSMALVPSGMAQQTDSLTPPGSDKWMRVRAPPVLTTVCKTA